jgi:GGDEF domain-containing protein
MNKNAIIKYLSTDRAFGILSRNALELQIKNLDSPFDAIFFDFYHLKELNMKIGYKEVNEKIREMFKTFSFRKTDLIGRWFYGDEIVIITTNESLSELTERLLKHCGDFGLFFKYKTFYNIRAFHQLEDSIYAECNPRLMTANVEKHT